MAEGNALKPVDIQRLPIEHKAFHVIGFLKPHQNAEENAAHSGAFMVVWFEGTPPDMFKLFNLPTHTTDTISVQHPTVNTRWMFHLDDELNASIVPFQAQ